MGNIQTHPSKVLWWLVASLILWMGIIEAFGPRFPVRLFDTTCGGYNGAEAQQLIAALSANDIGRYAYRQIPLDMVFLVLYGAAFHLLLRWMAAANGARRVVGTLISLVPVLAAVSDFTENILVFSMIAPETPRTAVAPVASLFTQVKCVSIFASLALALGLGVRMIISGRGHAPPAARR